MTDSGVLTETFLRVGVADDPRRVPPDDFDPHTAPARARSTDRAREPGQSSRRSSVR